MKKVLLLLAAFAATAGAAQAQCTISATQDSAAKVKSANQAEFYFSIRLADPWDSTDNAGAICAKYPDKTPFVDVVTLGPAYGTRTSYAQQFNNMNGGTYAMTVFASSPASPVDLGPWEYFQTIEMGPSAVVASEVKQNVFALRDGRAIECTLWQNTVYRVYDMSGKIVMQIPATGERTAFDGSRLADGMYILEAANENIKMRRSLTFASMQ